MAQRQEWTTVALILLNIVAWPLVFWTLKRLRGEQMERIEERKLRDELDAYAGLDPAGERRESPRELARRVCATVVKFSAFRQIAMLMRDAENRLHVVGSAGVDDLMALEINGWVARFARARRTGKAQSDMLKSFPGTLEWDEAFEVTRPLGARGIKQLGLKLQVQQFSIIRKVVAWSESTSIYRWRSVA